MKHYEIVSLEKPELNSIEILIFKTLIDSVLCYDEFVLINKVLKEYSEMNEEINN